MKKNELVTVYTAWGIVEADTVKSLLDSAEIRSLMISNSSPSVHAFSVDGMGKIEIKTSGEDAETALALISGEGVSQDDQPEDN